MDIQQRVDHLRELAAQRGDYRFVAEKSGLTFHWLQKFASGAIENPTVANVAKLEAFFMAEQQDAA